MRFWFARRAARPASTDASSICGVLTEVATLYVELVHKRCPLMRGADVMLLQAKISVLARHDKPRQFDQISRETTNTLRGADILGNWSYRLAMPRRQKVMQPRRFTVCTFFEVYKHCTQAKQRSGPRGAICYHIYDRQLLTGAFNALPTVPEGIGSLLLVGQRLHSAIHTLWRSLLHGPTRLHKACLSLHRY